MPPLGHIALFAALCAPYPYYVVSFSVSLVSPRSRGVYSSHHHTPSSPSWTTCLFYNADSSSSADTSSSTSSNTQKKSRPERKALERERKQQNPVSSEDKVLHHRRKHNYKQRETLLLSKDNTKSQKSYELHSNLVSVLHSKSTVDEVLKAIKRAQNLHDVHDIRNIERFLLEEVDESFAFGYRGSLLARLAVAALHMNPPQHILARRAMDARLIHHRDSILPMESAAIIRGLLRVHNVTDALLVLEDELSIPLVCLFVF